MKKIQLKVKNISFYSIRDEEIFFEWLDRIFSVLHYQGIGNTLVIFVNQEVKEEDLRDVLALFYRYDIDMKQLTIFHRKENSEWFYSPTSYWFEAVFR